MLTARPAHAQDDAKETPATAAQETPVAPIQPPGPVVNLRERPHVTADPQRLRRTPQIDGTLADGEWDAWFTSSDGPVKGTVYCNWDDDFLYLATKTDRPCSLLIDLDAGGDGWLRSADNVELVVGSLGDVGAPTVVTRLLDAANSKDAPTWNEKTLDPKSVVVKTRTNDGSQVVEIAIPKSLGSLVLRAGATIGLRVEFLPPIPANAYVPTQPFEPHLLLDATLADARVSSVPGINPKLTLSDNKCVAGQKLFATLDLLNQTDVNVAVQSVLWTGEGTSANAVNTSREVSVPPIPAGKHLKRTYKTVLPDALAPGSYTLTVVSDLGSGRLVRSQAAFTVVEPLQVQMKTDPDPVAIVGPTQFTVSVDVYSAVPDHAKCVVELLTLPAGWELTNGRKHGLTVDGEDKHAATNFVFKLPSTTPGGDVPLEATVTRLGRTWKTRTTAHVTRPVSEGVKKP